MRFSRLPGVLVAASWVLLLVADVDARCRTLHHQGRRIASFGCDPSDHGLTRRMLADLNRSSPQEMLIGTKSSPPFSFVPDDDSVDPTSMRYPYTGFSWDLFEDWVFPVAQSNGLNFTSFRVVPFVSNTQILQAVANGDIDMGHAAITKTPQREEFVDFSTGWYDTGLSVMARANDADIATQALNTLQGTGTIFFNLLALLAIAVLMMAVVLFTLERTSPGSRPVIRRGCCTGLKDSGVLIMLLLAGVDIRLPSGRCSRPAGALCSMCSGLLAILVTAMSTVVLQSASNTFSIQNFADLSGHTVIAVGGTTGERYVEANGINVDILPVATVDEMFARFQAGDGDALFYDKPILDAFIASDTAETGNERFALRGQIHLQQQYGIAMSPHLGKAAKEAVDRSILSFYGSDEFKVLQARWLGVALESSADPQADPAAVTRFLEDYFWLIAMGGGAIIGVALLIGLVGMAVRYQMSKEPSEADGGQSVLRRTFGCCFGKDQSRGRARDKIAEMKRARRGSVVPSSVSSPSGPAPGGRPGDADTIRPADPTSAGQARPQTRSVCASCFNRSKRSPADQGTAAFTAPGTAQQAAQAPWHGRGLAAAGRVGKPGSGTGGDPSGISDARRLGWELGESRDSKRVGPSPHRPNAAGTVGALNQSVLAAESLSRDVTSPAADDEPAEGDTASPHGAMLRALTKSGTGTAQSSAAATRPRATRGTPSSHQVGESRDHAAPQPSMSESGGPTASSAVAKAFGGVQSASHPPGAMAAAAGLGDTGSSVAGSSGLGGSVGDGETPSAGRAAGAGLGDGFGAGLGMSGHPSMMRLETSPAALAGDPGGWREMETPRTFKVHEAQAKTLSKQASGIEAALANLSFRLPKPGEVGGAVPGGGGRGGGSGGLGLPAGASLEMDADERLFLKREQWRLRYASRLAPILPPNDLIWMIYERVDILTQQALLQRAMGRLDVPADLEEVSPKDLTGEAEDIRLFLVSKGVAARTAASLAVLVAMGGTLNDHDDEGDKAALTQKQQTGRVMGASGNNTVMAVDRSLRDKTTAAGVKKKTTSATRKLQMQARMVGALAKGPTLASVLQGAPPLKTAGSASRRPVVPGLSHRSSSVGPTPQRSASRPRVEGAEGRVARGGVSPVRKGGSSAASGGRSGSKPRSRHRKAGEGKRSGKSGRSKSSKSKRKLTKAEE